ncbi:MAG: hypothetical protein ACXVRJ_12505 [Gaiellaceae bacterium]
MSASTGRSPDDGPTAAGAGTGGATDCGGSGAIAGAGGTIREITIGSGFGGAAGVSATT